MEIHVQLATASKMFTAAANAFGADPNTLVDEQVLGLPGVLPVMNKKAVEYAILVGLALGCKIAKHTKWDRKSYFYPDLPKNYQISQYDLPLCAQGIFHLALKDGSVKPVRIRRAHLEEDAGKLLHEAPGGHPINFSIVDLNRAAAPLLEIVTEPDLSSGHQVAAFAQELQKLVGAGLKRAILGTTGLAPTVISPFVSGTAFGATFKRSPQIIAAHSAVTAPKATPTSSNPTQQNHRPSHG